MKGSPEDTKEDSPSMFVELFKSEDYVSVMSSVMRLESLFRQNRSVIVKFIEEMKDFRAVMDILSNFDLKVTDMNLIFKILHKVVEEIKSYPEWKWCIDAILKRLFERHSTQMSIVFYRTLKCDLQTPLLKLFSLCVLLSEDAAHTFVTNAIWSDLNSTLTVKAEGSSRLNTLILYSSILYSTRTSTLNIFLQSGSLAAIFADMENDYYLPTRNIIKLLKEKILLNTSIEKNIKLKYLFNSTILTPVYSFQSWTKPYLKLGTNALIPNAEQAKSLLTDEIIEFLEVICCSSEFGILIESEDEPKHHANSSVIEIMRGFKPSQLQCSKTRGFVAKALATSMDLYNGYSFSIMRKLNLSTEKSHVWLRLYADYLHFLNMEELSTMSEKECYERLVPFPITRETLMSFTASTLSSDIKYSAFSFMYACIENTKKLYELMVLEQSGQAQTLVERIKVFIQDSFPGCNALVILWKEIVHSDQGIVNTETISDLEVLVKLLCRIIEWFPSPEMVEVINADEILSIAQKINTDDPSKLSLIINCLSLSNSLQSTFSKSKETTLAVSLKNLFDIYLSLHSETGSSCKNLEALKDHITKSLRNFGFSQFEANIEIWLQNLIGRSPKCVDFLCNSLQTTIKNLDDFYDESVLTVSNYNSKLLAMSELKTKASPSISRLIFGCIEEVSSCDRKVKYYFTDTLHLYFMSLPNPKALVELILSKEIYPELTALCQCWCGRKPTENIYNKTGDTFSEKLDEIFFSKHFKNVDSMLQSSELPKDLDHIKDVVRKVVSYYQVDISTPNKKANGAYLKILQWVVDNSSNFINVVCSLILNQEFFCNEYKAFVKNDISDFVDLLLSKKVSDSKDALIFFNEAHKQLKVMLKEGTCSSETDFVKPFQNYLNNDQLCNRKFVNSISSLFIDLIKCSNGHLKFDSYVSLLMKMTLFVKKHGSANKNKYFEDIFNFCKWNIKTNDELNDLYAALTSYLAMTVSPKRLNFWTSSDINWMVSHCHITGSELLVRVVESNPTNHNMVLSAMKDAQTLLPGGMVLIHYFFEKGSMEKDLSVKLLSQLREPVLSWLGNYDSENDLTFVYFCSQLLEPEVNLIEVSDISPIIKKFHKKLVCEGEMPPQHISTVAMLCEKLKGHKKESKLASGDALITSLEMLLSTLDKIYDTDKKMLTNTLASIDALLPKFKNRTKVTKVDSKLLQNVMKKMVEYGMVESTDSKIVDCARGIYEFQSSVDEDFNNSQLFSSIVTHKNFNALMLVSRNTGDVKLKASVAFFLHSILLKCPSVAEQLDVRGILASYSATNKPSDQILLKILHLYESWGAMQHIRPVLFGERAQEYFGLTETTPQTYILPNNDQILGGLNDVILVKTCLHFDRRITARVPESVSESPVLIYDVRFLLPVLSLVADEYLLGKKVPQENVTAKVLAVSVACLSAEDSTLRSISIGILRTMKSVYNFCTVSAMKTYWHTLIDVVVYSLAQMGHKAVAYENKTLEKKNKSKNIESVKTEDVTVVALPSPITRFIVETILVTEHPDHPLYKILRNYMFLFSTINTIRVPEKQRLFNDSNVESIQHSRMLLLRLVSDGLKTEDDARLIIMNDIVPLLMSLLESPTANQQLQIEVFSALISVASTQYGCNRLLRHSELLQMLPMYLTKVKTDSFWDYKASLGRLSNSLLKLLETLWQNGHSKVELVKSEEKDTITTEVNGEMEEQNLEYYEEDEEDYFEAYSDDEEEKSKLRKKRKQEAKNRKAAKRQKLEAAASVVTADSESVTEKVYTKSFDFSFHLDFSQCIYGLVKKIKEDSPSTSLFDDLVKSVVTSIATRERNERLYNSEMLDDVARELSELVSEGDEL